MSQQYPSNWDSRRKQVYKRDNHTCQNCGAQGGTGGNAELHAHHIVPKSKGGTHKLSNLKTVCKDCHNAIHGNSVAPSAQQSPYSTDADLNDRYPLDVDDYPYTAIDDIRCINAMKECYDDYNAIDDAIDEVVNYMEMASSIPEDEIPDQLLEQCLQAFENADSEIRDLERDVEALNEAYTDQFSVQVENPYQSFVEEVERDIEKFDAYLDTIVELLGNSDTSEAEFLEIKLASKRMHDSVEETGDAFGELTSAFSSLIDIKVLEAASYDDTEKNVYSFDKCPFCGKSSDLNTPKDGIVKCQGCKIELRQEDSRLYSLVNGPSEWNSVEILDEYWKRLGENEFETTKSVQEITQHSAKIVRTLRKRTILIGCATLLMVGISIFGGSTLLFFLSLLIGAGVVYLSKRQLESKIEV